MTIGKRILNQITWKPRSNQLNQMPRLPLPTTGALIAEISSRLREITTYVECRLLLFHVQVLLSRILNRYYSSLSLQLLARTLGLSTYIFQSICHIFKIRNLYHFISQQFVSSPVSLCTYFVPYLSTCSSPPFSIMHIYGCKAVMLV